MEVWKEVVGFENYEVSDFGEVRNKKTNRILKKELCRGYLRVSLCKNGCVKRFLIHRLVAISFIKEGIKKCVNHIDGNKLNNFLTNLEWSTHSENEIHSYNILGKINPIRKLSTISVNDIRENCIKGSKGNVTYFISKYNVDRKTILNVLNNVYYV